VHVVKGRTFSCINPEHDDRNPSCGLYMGSEGTPMFHCFSCGVSGSIFEAVHFLEGKPLSGRGFLMDTLPYLAQMYGVELPELDACEDDLYEMETYQAYQHAAYIIRHSTLSERVQAKLAEYSWSKDTLATIGIGSVASYDDYLHRMTAGYGHKREFLKEVDLDRKSLFNENNLIYTQKDEHGSPVGFAARDLFYEEKQAQYEKRAEELKALCAGDEKKLKEELGKLFKPRKYNNSAESEVVDGENGRKETRPKNRIYKKGTRLFNFDQAKKATPPLEVFEGQADCVTAFNAGMKNTTAIGSTAFSEDHLDLILNADPPIKHLVFTLDADEAGKKGTEKFVKLLEEKLGGHPGLKVELRLMPDGSDDPDRFIRTCGIKAFRELPKEDLFSWRIRQAVERGEDAVALANDAVNLIINETNVLFRREMARKLSRATGQPEDVIWDEVLRRSDVDRALIESEKSSVANRMINDIKKHPERASALIARAATQMELVEKQRHGYDPVAVVNAIDHTYERADRNENRIGLYTGFKLFDERMRGVPKFEKFISVPGKPNHCKSTLMDNLGWRLATLNGHDVLVLFHTADDSLYERHSRIISSYFHLPSELFEVPDYYLKARSLEASFSGLHC
jgi:DNA primase